MERDNRKLAGTICIFNTHGQDSDLKKYDGMQCQVVKRIDETEYDFEEVGTMWSISMICDDYKTEAFTDELEQIS